MKQPETELEKRFLEEHIKRSLENVPKVDLKSILEEIIKPVDNKPTNNKPVDK